MTPEYLEKLADIADPEQLWRLPMREQMRLSRAKRYQLDSGVALRRHASHVRELARLLAVNRSLLITPLGPNSTAVKIVRTPSSHRLLKDQHEPLRHQ